MSDEYREYLKTLEEFRLYKKYIDERLAGDFAFELSNLLKAKTKRITELEAQKQKRIELLNDTIDKNIKLEAQNKKLCELVEAIANKSGALTDREYMPCKKSIMSALKKIKDGTDE